MNSGQRTPAARLAFGITEVTAPTVLVTGLLAVVAQHDAPDLGHGALWGVIAVLFGTAVPMSFVFYGVRRRRWSDHHVPERSKRMQPMLFGCASVAVGYVLLRVTDAPKDIATVYAAMITEALILTAITRFWKISGHVAAAASCATVLTFVYGPALALTWAAVPVIAWARVQTRKARLAEAHAEGSADDHDELDGHTPAQTVAAALVAAAIVTTAYVTIGGL
ncbi:hypothetical protein [Frankia sp. EAN1pec]|uniref:hypothetical protein n=1 Tax=Parafrankia sp. (strain EAN1pec) TaxID=298653 RepID=UPI000313797D